MLLQQQVSLVSRPSSSFPSLAVWLSRRGPGTFSDVSDVMDRENYANMRSYKPHNNFAHVHSLECYYSESKNGSTQRRFWSLFTRQSRGHHVLVFAHCCHAKPMYPWQGLIQRGWIGWLATPLNWVCSAHNTNSVFEHSLIYLNKVFL